MMNIILFIAAIIYIFYISNSYYKSHGDVQKLLLVFLFIVHFTAMGLSYRDTIDFLDNDVFYFYNSAKNADSWMSLFGLGSFFMSFLIYPLVQAGSGRVTLFVFFMIFAAISYQCFLWFFDQMSEQYSKRMLFRGIPITQFIFLLPSFHYWSGFLGKDVLVFFFLTYLLFEFKKNARLNFLHIIVLVLLFLLRPHIFVVVLLALMIYYLTQKNVSKIIKIKLSILSLIIAGISIPVLFHFTHIKTLTYSSILQKISVLNSYALNSGSGISLDETSYLERIWLLLFRPFFL